MRLAVDEARVSAVATGSLFVYKGRLRGGLVNYPSRQELRSVFE